MRTWWSQPRPSSRHRSLSSRPRSEFEEMTIPPMTSGIVLIEQEDILPVCYPDGCCSRTAAWTGSTTSGSTIPISCQVGRGHTPRTQVPTSPRRHARGRMSPALVDGVCVLTALYEVISAFCARVRGLGAKHNNVIVQRKSITEAGADRGSTLPGSSSANLIFPAALRRWGLLLLHFTYEETEIERLSYLPKVMQL